MWDSAMAENGILKVGRVTDFQAHQMEHQLGAYTDCNHGQGLAVIHPAYYRHIVKDAEEKFQRFGKEVFGVDTAQAGVEALAREYPSQALPLKLDLNDRESMRLAVEKTWEHFGTIVNVTSIGAVRGALGNGYYFAAKGALELLTEALAKETEHLGIRTMLVEPGAFRTNFYGEGLLGRDAAKAAETQMEIRLKEIREWMEVSSQSDY